MKLFKLHEAKTLSEMIEPDTGPAGERIDGKPEVQAKYDEINKKMSEVENASKNVNLNVSSQMKDLEKKLSDKSKGIQPIPPSTPQPGGTSVDRPSAHF